MDRNMQSTGIGTHTAKISCPHCHHQYMISIEEMTALDVITCSCGYKIELSKHGAVSRSIESTNRGLDHMREMLENLDDKLSSGNDK